MSELVFHKSLMEVEHGWTVLHVKRQYCFCIVSFAVELISFLTISPLEEYVLRSFFFSPLIKTFFSTIRWQDKKWVYSKLSWLEMCVQVKNRFNFESQPYICQN